MVMKNAENAPNFYQIDNKIEYMQSRDGVIILPSILAWEKFKWTLVFNKNQSRDFFYGLKNLFLND